MKSIQLSSIRLVFCALLIVVIFITVTKGEFIPRNENATQDEFQSAIGFQTDSKGRFIRSLFDRMPLILTIEIPTVTGEIMHMKWQKIQNHYLANEYLPVIFSSQSTASDVMEDVGEFVIYRDVLMCSAVVYFKKSHSLSGPIGLKYYLVNLPYDFDGAGKYLGVVEQSYIRFEGDGPGHNNPLFSYLSQILPDTLDDDAGPSHKRQRVERNVNSTSYGYKGNTSESITRGIRGRRARATRVYCLEILIFITHDVAQMYKNVHEGDIYVREVVKDYIIYFNAIDMLFHKLSSTKNLRLNMAKIVIEDVSNSFDFTSEHEIEFHITVAKLRQHLHHNHDVYPRDSYDHVFVSTNHPIKTGGIYIPGITTPTLDMYEARRRNKYDNGAAITILGYSQPYVLAVHEISKIFNLKTDSWTDGLELTGQCNSIMQEGSSRCEKCLKWSTQSEIEFGDFFRNNRNRCFFLNMPRSLHPPRGPSYRLTPTTLCQCFGYEYYRLTLKGGLNNKIGIHQCNSPLGCRYSNAGEIVEQTTIYPPDGTRCDNKKVCWNHVCTYYMPKFN